VYFDSREINKQTKATVTIVGIHVRRGDMRRQGLEKIGYRLATAEYIERAMAYFEDLYWAPGDNKFMIFVVCSDDISWFSREVNTYKAYIVYSHDHTAAEDMAVLSLCDHVITTVGTFSWWAGWLSGGTVVYYGGYPKPNTTLYQRMNKNDFYPPEWIRLE
jgi:galactoside 2-L-fucosyltransferase 1/2